MAKLGQYSFVVGLVLCGLVSLLVMLRWEGSGSRRSSGYSALGSQPGDLAEADYHCPQLLRSSSACALPQLYLLSPVSEAVLWAKADVTRQSQTLRSLPGLHWALVANGSRSGPLRSALRRSCLSHAHLAAPAAADSFQPFRQLNRALRWLTEGLASGRLRHGVVHFAEPRNVYDLRIFPPMRLVKEVGMWPVGMDGGVAVKVPLANGSFAFHDGQRRRDADPPLSSFAFSTLLLQNKEAEFDERCGAEGAVRCFLQSLGVARSNTKVELLMTKSREILVYSAKTFGAGSRGDLHGFVVKR